MTSCHCTLSSVTGAAGVGDFAAVEVAGVLFSRGPPSGGEVVVLSGTIVVSELGEAGAMDEVAVTVVVFLTSLVEGGGEIIISGWEIIISDVVPPFGVDLGGVESTARRGASSPHWWILV